MVKLLGATWFLLFSGRKIRYIENFVVSTVHRTMLYVFVLRNGFDHIPKSATSSEIPLVDSTHLL